MTEAPSNRGVEPIRAGRVVGLTGAIGAGKSSVAERLRQLGATVIDADKVGHEVLRQPAVASRLVEEFGGEIVDATGVVDRRRLGAIVFADAEQRHRLEAVMHPVMRSVFEQRIGAAESSAPLVALDAALLCEAGWDSLCRIIVFVDAAREQRLDRLRRSRGWSDDELARRERAQWPLEKKRRRADVLVTNEGSETHLCEQVDQLFEEWAGGPLDAAPGPRDADRTSASIDAS